MKKYLILLPLMIIFLLTACGSDIEENPSSPIHKQIKAGEDFEFFVVADPHYLSDSLHDDKEAFQRFIGFSDRVVKYSSNLVDATFEEIIDKKPDFVIFPGDLTCNGERASHTELAAKMKMIEDAGISVYVVPGNHDILNPMARQFFEMTTWSADYINKDNFEEIYADYGYNEAIMRDKDSLSYMVQPTEDVWFLMLDSAIYKDNISLNKSVAGGNFSDKTRHWIEDCSDLAKDKDVKLVAVMHHNLLDQSELINEDYTIEDSKKITELFLECGIELTLSGHMHIQSIRSARDDDDVVYDIATSCLSVFPNQYGRVTYESGKGYSYKTTRVDMEAYAAKNDIQDSNLLNFEDYSIEVFKARCCNRQQTCLNEQTGLSKEELDEVSKVVAEMNMLYFSGYRNDNLEHLVRTDGYKTLQKLPECFLTSYVEDMLNDDRSNHTKIFIPSS